jgi:hypothetical protein
MTDQENQEKNKLEQRKRISELVQKKYEATLDLPLRFPVKFPEGPEKVCCIPNSFLRSALFGAIKKGRRAYIQRQEMASVNGLRVIFSGPRLDQADLDVWEQALRLVKNEGFEGKVLFSIRGFLKAIGRNTGKSDREWLQGALIRLATSVVEITDGRKTYFGAMLSKGAKDEETGEYLLELNKDIMRLYGSDGWTGLEWKQRYSLRGSTLAQWLHGFYSTHKNPYPYSVETIHKLSGSETESLRKFKQNLKISFEKITAVTGWTFQIDEKNLIHMNKNTDNAIPFISQKKFR